MSQLSGRAFTLVELLVVITIIVVLLALLAPALDKAIYQAELVVCAGRLKSGAVGVQGYAMDSRRAYPLRAGPRDETLEWGPNLIANRLHDDRPTIFRAAPAALLLDPFSPRINLETTVPDNFITTHYFLWFGWSYHRDDGTGMNRLGERFGFQGARYSVLLSDQDLLAGPTAPPGYEASSHPDRLGRMFSWAFQDVVNPWPGWNLHGAFATYSGWTSQNTGQTRGELDLNHAYDDGSVLRFGSVIRDDPRMAFVPTQHLGTAANLAAGRLQIPRQ